MNTKNLLVRFVILAALVAASIYGLWTYGLRQGIDLRGGHSLIFEIRSNEAEIKAMQEDAEAIRQKLAEAGDAEAEQTQELQKQLSALEADIENAQRAGDPGDLAERMISILKNRVDPNGLMALEWTPLGNNRIEVRMPAASPESEALGRDYRQAFDELIQSNLQRSEIRRVLAAPVAERQQRVDELAEGSLQKERFEALLAAHDALQAAEAARQVAREALTNARAGGKTDTAALEQAASEAQAGYDNALVRYEDALTALDATNVSSQQLATILGLYVPPSEAKALKNDAEVARRREAFQQELDEMLAAHPARAERIQGVAEAYKKWADVRKHLEDPADLRRLIAKAGVLEFRIAPYAPGTNDTYAISAAEFDRYLESLKSEGPEGLRRRNERLQWFPIRENDRSYGGLVTAKYGGTDYLLLSNQPGYTMLREFGQSRWKLAKVYQTLDETHRPAVGFEFDGPGAKRFGALTSGNVGRSMAILLDDEVYSAPRINEAISKSGIITMGSAAPQEVGDLIRTLEAGSLPAKLNPEPVSVSSFGPSIGAVNRELGIRAAYWGLIAVAVFMLLYYLLAGAIADVALVLNILLVLGAMSLFSAVFTLPGIAGIILTIGIAVDANVLIFERLREEQTKGQSIRMAIKNAYERAFSAIFDANITTLLTCMILGWFGTEEVRGFAITLGLGVLFSMFTALVVTRWIFQVLLNLGVLKSHVPMLRLVGVPRVNWMSKRYVFWTLSLAFVVLGMASVVWQGKDIFGIEFSSGTQAEITFVNDALIDGKLPDDATVRDMFKAQAGELGYDKLQATARVETRLNPARVDQFLAEYSSADSRDRVTLADWEARKMAPAFFQAVDADGDGVLTRQELQETLPPLDFQISTTETSVDKIRQTAREVFGNELQERVEHQFEQVAGERIELLGVSVPADGRLRITEDVRRQMTPVYREDLLDYEGGVLFVVQNVEPSLSKGELIQRIAEMREQPDFADQSVNPTEVLGLTPAEDDTFTSFAVAVRPAEAAMVDRPGAWDDFAAGENELIGAALEREEAINVRSFDAQLSREAAMRAGFAVILSWIAIVIYLWVRFGNWRWGLAAVVCLIHDVVIVVGLVAASAWIQNTAIGDALGIQSFKIDLAMVAAILTVIGYSVNDTIVVFDRIRENRGKLTTVSPLVINTSINQTLSRTLLTSGTTFIVVIIMYVMGGSGIHAFNYALLAGIVFGTYSSVAVASPLLMGFRKALVARTAGAVAEAEAK